MAELHFQARSRSGSTWGGVVQGSAAHCAQRQFMAGAMEVELIGAQGRTVVRPGERVEEPAAQPVVLVDGALAEATAGARRRIWLRLVCWGISIIAILLVAAAVTTLNAGKALVTRQASSQLKAKGQEGIVEATLTDVDWDGGLVYRFQVLLDGKPAMKATYDVLGSEARLGR